MNTNNVRKYAPKARKAFIEAMSKQAAKYGITKKRIEPAEQKGDLVLIGDRPFPASVIKPRERLVKRIEQQGFDQVMEHVAYSWFNRLCAIRYMEHKGFLDHGRHVLSAAGGSAGVPQILEECLEVELPGLDQAKVRELKLDGTKDEELYRELLLAQCHALHQAMPFLFEAVADESELLLPENLTKSDSLIRDLVASIPDEEWNHIEIIGWLYQFYISEKKDQVMGKVVKSEDIPAATQLFTPNWIVQYLVQNSVGRQWLQTYPDSPLREKMPYYIEPAEQTPEVQAQLRAMIPKELKPETLSCIDPAVGSGHLLIEAYKVFKAIYEERGYRTRDIPQLILENNLFGLDIDDRAGQLAGFALMMLAREDDRRIFSRNIRLNVLSLQESANVNLPSLWQSLNLTGEWESGTSQGLFEEEQQDLSAFTADNRCQLLQRILEGFKQAKTFGSLIDVPHDDCEELKDLLITLIELEESGDSMQKAAASQLLPYVHQAVLLAQKYDAVAANPPYMGGKGMNKELKDFSRSNFPQSSADLFSVSAERYFSLSKPNRIISLMTPFTWMFLKAYEDFRKNILQKRTITSLVHPEYHAFFDSAFVSVCAFSMQVTHIDGYKADFIDLSKFYGAEQQPIRTLEAIDNAQCGWRFVKAADDFKKIPCNPIAYWISDKLTGVFERGELLGNVVDAAVGLQTGDNDQFLRQWTEVSCGRIGYHLTSTEEASKSSSKWFPYNKGGFFRRWYGNQELVVNWSNNGEEIRCFFDDNGKLRSRPQNTKYYFRPSVSWSDITSGPPSFRVYPSGFIHDVKGMSAFSSDEKIIKLVAAFCNTPITTHAAKALNPGVNFQVGNFITLPYIDNIDDKSKEDILTNVERLISIHKKDWDLFERAWGFKVMPLIPSASHLFSRIRDSFNSWLEENSELILTAKDLEEKNNEIFITAYGLEGEIPPSVPLEQITLSINPAFRYDGDSSEDERSSRFLADTAIELLSYSIGCMVGRYSIDRTGLVYAHSGNEGFSELVFEGAYNTFPADDDGVIPLTDQEWFPDDATNRFREFVKVVWGEEHLQENLDFVAESLCLHAIKPKKSESSIDTIRRYLSTQFYKDHLKTYKKRPIYWLFSSGKQKAFECLVYLHRYNEGTLARIRTEYVIPLTAKMAAYAQKLESDKEASGSAAEVKRLEKEIAQLHKQQAELSEFDEKLRHYADQRISLDLDDGVKVNYGKFGDLLAEVKAITGEAPEE